ncbi:MAG: purine-nucleoside phosphorylase [Flavobacteriaceae bacterium]|nr:purine-nucleoside phosphorylase [Flavobacteriaceae bacterium]
MFNLTKKQQLQESVTYLQANGITIPKIGIVLGTGLGKLVNEIHIEKEILYTDIPHFPKSTVSYHAGKLIYGTLCGKKIVVMHGHFHLYEGYSHWQVTYGIRVMHALGIENLFISNAAGAINLNFNKGDLMLLEDHLNLQGGSPLAFANVGEFGDQFTDMLSPYAPILNKKLKAIAQNNDVVLRTGVYAAVFGPQLETKAEYRMLQILEVDAVGMSTVPEVIVANHLRLPCAAISIITDTCDPKNLQAINIEEIISIVGDTEPKLIFLLKKIIESI